MPKDKYVCYLYHINGKRLITAQETDELVRKQLHGLRVTSVHMFKTPLHSSGKIYSLHVWEKQGKMHAQIIYGKFSKKEGTAIREGIVTERGLKLAEEILHIVRAEGYKTKVLDFDMIVDISGTPCLIRITRLKLDINTIKISMNTKVTLLYANEGSNLTTEADRESKMKNNHSSKSDNIKSSSLNSNCEVFLEMIAKTISKTRKKEEKNESNKLILAKSIEKIRMIQERKMFENNCIKEVKITKAYESIQDLLFYVKKTRPRIWRKDISQHSKPMKPKKLAIISKRSILRPTNLFSLRLKHRDL